MALCCRLRPIWLTVVKSFPSLPIIRTQLQYITIRTPKRPPYDIRDDGLSNNGFDDWAEVWVVKYKITELITGSAIRRWWWAQHPCESERD